MIFNEVGAKSLFRQDVISSVEPCHYRGSSVVGNSDNMISIIKHCLEEKIQKLEGTRWMLLFYVDEGCVDRQVDTPRGRIVRPTRKPGTVSTVVRGWG